MSVVKKNKRSVAFYNPFRQQLLTKNNAFCLHRAFDVLVIDTNAFTLRSAAADVFCGVIFAFFEFYVASRFQAPLKAVLPFHRLQNI